jgi:hypothetical protein
MNRNDSTAEGDNSHLDEILKLISTLPIDWHGAGTVCHDVLEAIVTHAKPMGPIQCTCETGSGRTTLLLSHISANHTVFAVDMDASITQVRASPLLNQDTTTFVESPTQRSLPTHNFSRKHQIVLIDGPHGYPFPDLEFYFLYPTIEQGGLLILDDIRIPSIRRMHDIIAAGPMFKLIDIVAENTSFFRRTDAPLLNPEGDDWWLQNYNKKYFDELMKPQRPTAFGHLMNWCASHVPETWQKKIPSKLKHRLIKMSRA